MARFEDFDRHEKRVLREAMAWAQSEFYDPGHTEEDRGTLQALIQEAKAAELAEKETKKGRADAPDDTPDKNDGDTDNNVTGTPRAPEKEESAILWYIEPSDGQAAIEKPTRKAAETVKAYKGFLYVKCRECGSVHGFCAKMPIRFYKCRECGEMTKLENMAPLRIRCECGAKFRYDTNVVTGKMDVSCLACDTPVAVEWNEKQQQYDTIGAFFGRSGGKKGGRK